MSTAVEAVPTGDENTLEKKLAALDLNEQTSEQPTQSSSVAASLREKTDGVRKTPFVDPLPSAKPKPHAALTPQQQAKYDELLETVKGWKEIPSADGKGGPISESEIMWLTRDCLLRYLRATKWKTHEAATRILATLTWRREYVVGVITGDHISPENETGKQLILGFDNEARPCLYLNPGRQNTQPSPRQVQHLVFMVERVIDLMPPGQESLALLINFKKSESRSNTSPPLSQGREVLHILQTHYPERLGKALIINVPWVVWGFFKLITPFIDPLTREKLKFNEDVGKYVPREHLWTEFKGNVEFEYDHDTYWPVLNQLCAERAAEMKARWVKAGKQYGENEEYLRGGNVPHIGISKPTASIPLKSAEDEKPVPQDVAEASTAAKAEASAEESEVAAKEKIEEGAASDTVAEEKGVEVGVVSEVATNEKSEEAGEDSKVVSNENNEEAGAGAEAEAEVVVKEENEEASKATEVEVEKKVEEETGEASKAAEEEIPSEAAPLKQPDGSQANGKADIVAVKEDPKVTAEGDKA